MKWFCSTLLACTLALSGCAFNPPHMQGMQCERQTVTRLVFGMNSPRGPVSDAQFNDFLATAVTPRFPAGLTVIEARGQWRNNAGVIERENSRVLEIVSASSPADIQNFMAIVDVYKKQFAQESVLVTQHGAQACF